MQDHDQDVDIINKETNNMQHQKETPNYDLMEVSCQNFCENMANPISHYSSLNDIEILEEEMEDINVTLEDTILKITTLATKKEAT